MFIRKDRVHCWCYLYIYLQDVQKMNLLTRKGVSSFGVFFLVWVGGEMCIAHIYSCRKDILKWFVLI